MSKTRTHVYWYLKQLRGYIVWTFDEGEISQAESFSHNNNMFLHWHWEHKQTLQWIKDYETSWGSLHASISAFLSPLLWNLILRWSDRRSARLHGGRFVYMQDLWTGNRTVRYQKCFCGRLGSHFISCSHCFVSDVLVCWLCAAACALNRISSWFQVETTKQTSHKLQKEVLSVFLMQHIFLLAL